VVSETEGDFKESIEKYQRVLKDKEKALTRLSYIIATVGNLGTPLYLSCANTNKALYAHFYSLP